MTEARSVRPVRILIVDDDEADVMLTRESLRRSKIANEFFVVSDGSEAVRYLLREPPYESAVRPDLILLDLHMPIMDGRDVLELIKQEPELRSIPVVVLTASDSEADVLASDELQASCYVTKPVGLDSFQRVVHSIQTFYFSVVQLP